MGMRIAIVDDNPVNQNSFRQKIEPYTDLELVLVSDSGDSFLEHMKGSPVNNWPEVVFMDIQMPGLSGVETIRIAKALYPSIYYIVWASNICCHENSRIYKNNERKKRFKQV